MYTFSTSKIQSVALHKLIRIFAKINRSMVILGQLTRSSRSQYNCPHSLISYDFLALEIIHNNNILKNTITSRSTLKRNVINGSLSDMPCWLYEHKWSIATTCMWHYKLFSSWIALNNIIRSSLNIDRLPALVSYLGHAKVISRSRDMGVNTWLLTFDVT